MVLGESLRAQQTELEFTGRPNSHVLSFWVTCMTMVFPLYGSCFSQGLVFLFPFISASLLASTYSCFVMAWCPHLLLTVPEMHL